MLLHTIRGLFDLLKRNVVTNIGGMYQQRTRNPRHADQSASGFVPGDYRGRAEQAREVSSRHLLYVQEVLEEVRPGSSARGPSGGSGAIRGSRFARLAQGAATQGYSVTRGLFFLALVAHGAMQFAIGIALNTLDYRACRIPSCLCPVRSRT